MVGLRDVLLPSAVLIASLVGVVSAAIGSTVATPATAATAAIGQSPSPAQLPAWKSYRRWCAECHGNTGDGTGPLASNPAPADFRACERLAEKTDEDLRKVILEGSKPMPGFRKKIKDPLVLDQLIDVVRAFGNCASSPRVDRR
jgi:hypothetical protein